MRKYMSRIVPQLAVFSALFLVGVAVVSAQAPGNADPNILLNTTALGFFIPSLGDFLTFAIKFLFVVAGLVALVYMLWGAFSWITSGGEADKIGEARKKIVAAIIGVLMIVAALSIIVALEEIVFKKTVCFGITCAISLPDLLRPNPARP